VQYRSITRPADSRSWSSQRWVRWMAAERLAPSVRPDEVPGLLGHPRSGWVGGDAQDMNAAGGKLDHKQHIQALEQDGIDVEEVAGQDSLGLGGKELPPSQPRTAWRRVDACPFEEQPHRA
jgi:hypothetical protein